MKQMVWRQRTAAAGSSQARLIGQRGGGGEGDMRLRVSCWCKKGTKAVRHRTAAASPSSSCSTVLQDLSYLPITNVCLLQTAAFNPACCTSSGGVVYPAPAARPCNPSPHLPRLPTTNGCNLLHLLPLLMLPLLLLPPPHAPSLCPSPRRPCQAGTQACLLHLIRGCGVLCSCS